PQPPSPSTLSLHDALPIYRERAAALGGQPHTSRAVSTMSSSFAFCSSAVIALPSTVEEKPHCPLRQSCSNGTYLAACSILRLRSSFFSSALPLLVTATKTTTSPRRTKTS